MLQEGVCNQDGSLKYTDQTLHKEHLQLGGSAFQLLPPQCGVHLARLSVLVVKPAVKPAMKRLHAHSRPHFVGWLAPNLRVVGQPPCVS